MTSTYFYYKIHKDHLCYIGKTADPKSRLSTHKSRTQSSNIPLYQTIRDNGGWDQFKFEIIDTQNLNRDQARQRERELYDQHNANMNTLTPNGRPAAVAYYQRNKDRLREIARAKYKKTKTEWKCPRKTPDQFKALHLYRIARTGRTPTDLTREKYGITQDEIDRALLKHQAE